MCKDRLAGPKWPVPQQQRRCIMRGLALKLSHFISVAALAGVSSVSLAGGAILVQAPVEKVFVPQGFDSNDKIEVIVHGSFNSTCYKMGPVTVTADDSGKKLFVTAEAFYYPDATCLQMKVSYIKSVEVDHHLTPGNYKIEVAGLPTLKVSPLNVAAAMRPEADDYLYASVYSATVEQTPEGDEEIVLKGQHPYLFDGCVKFESVKTYLGPDNVMVVQPITRIGRGEECRGSVALSRFEEHKAIPSGLNRGEYLLHVRVLDGNSVNQLFNIE
jgi:hypothetical protein